MAQFKKLWNERKSKDGVKEVITRKLLEEGKFINEIEKAYLDYAHIIAIIPKNKLIADLIEEGFDVQDIQKNAKEIINKVLKAIYDSVVGNSILKGSKFDGYYLDVIFNLVKKSDNIKIIVGKEVPLYVEDDNFICILAPKKDNSE